MIEYTYTIEFLPTNQRYHGSKYGKDADPEMFWVNYFTSSNVIKNLVLEFGKDSFIVVELTLYPNGGAWDAETEFLQKNSCANDPKWLNESNNDYCLPHNSEIFIQRMLNKYGVTHNSQIPEVIELQKLSYAITRNKEGWLDNQRIHYEETLGVTHPMKLDKNKKTLAESNLEKYGYTCVFAVPDIIAKIAATFETNYGGHPRKTKEVKDKYKNTILDNYGVDHYSKTADFSNKIDITWTNKSEEDLEKHKQNSRDVRANDPIINCPHCSHNIKGKGTYNRWHGDNCKLNPNNINNKIGSQCKIACDYCDYRISSGNVNIRKSFKMNHDDRCKLRGKNENN